MEEIYFRRSKIKNTIYDYESYLEIYPHGKFADDVRSRLNKPVRIIITQSYGKAETIQMPFEAVVVDFFRYSGFIAVSSDSSNYYATLRIQARGEPLGACYSVIGDNRQKNYNAPLTTLYYTGASLEGRI